MAKLEGMKRKFRAKVSVVMTVIRMVYTGKKYRVMGNCIAGSPGDINCGDPDGDMRILWKSYLYHMQQKAPPPKRIICLRETPGRPHHYGKEYHGKVSREDTERRLSDEGEGSYLVRESTRETGQFSLSMLFNGSPKHYRLYYDGKHYVGEKRFSTLQDLVADGLITMYLNTHAGEYIRQMCNEVSYEESPYMTINQNKKQMYYKSTRRRMKDKKPPLPARKSAPVQSLPPPLEGDEDPRFIDGVIHQYDEPEFQTPPVAAPAVGAVAECPLDEFPEPSADLMDSPGHDRVTSFTEASPEKELPNAKDFEKAHGFKTHNFMGLPWCDFCGNFMWGLIAQGVKCEDCGFSAHLKCSEKVPNACIPDMKFVKRVFGVDLTTLCKLYDTARPFVVEMCVKEIELRGMQMEGMYRVSGSKDEIEHLQAAFEQYGDQAQLDIKTYEDINVVSGCLKNFFRMLPIPLVTYDTYGMFVNAVRRLESDDKLEGLKVAVRNLPPAHYQALKYLIQHLYRVTEQARLNKMSSENLARIFAPTLLRSPDSMGIDLQAALQTEAVVVDTLIINNRSIFDF